MDFMNELNERTNLSYRIPGGDNESESFYWFFERQKNCIVVRIKPVVLINREDDKTKNAELLCN